MEFVQYKDYVNSFINVAPDGTLKFSNFENCCNPDGFRIQLTLMNDETRLIVMILLFSLRKISFLLFNKFKGMNLVKIPYLLTQKIIRLKN